MKVLWVLNKAIGKLAEVMNIETGGYGGWLEQSLDELSSCDSVSMVFLTSGSIKEQVRVSDGKNVYYMIPGGSAYSGFKDNKVNLSVVEGIIEKEKPDLIHLWGTESALSLVVAKASASIPKIVYIQGFMASIKRHYYESTDKKYLSKNKTFYDIVKFNSPVKAWKQISKKAENEAKVLSLSDAIICDSNWCEAVCNAINPELSVYKKKLPIDDVFKNAVYKNSGGHKIFTSSQYAPFKGFEVLLRALAIVRKRYSDVILNVPGGWNRPPVTLREKLTYSGYSNAMNKLISELGLKENVVNLGSLSRKQMAEYMERSDIFVQASTVENHSSTMREAMFVGMPCVVSNVGSTPEYVQNGVSGFIYRNTEPEVLAFYIMKLFKDSDLRVKMGSNAARDIRSVYEKSDEEDYYTIYSDLINSYKVKNTL